MKCIKSKVFFFIYTKSKTKMLFSQDKNIKNLRSKYVFILTAYMETIPFLLNIFITTSAM